MSKLVSKLGAGSPSLEFPGRASIRASTTLNEIGYWIRASTTLNENSTKLDQRFNFRPALAMPGEYLILSSTDGLTRDLIDALSRETEQTVKPFAETHSMVEIDVGQLASILETNRETLVRSGMVKKGSTQVNG
ncbi:MAG: hypothetical protein ABIL62_00525 [Planctomycetota bacterium]